MTDPAVELVMKVHKVSEEEALEFYADEIVSARRLLKVLAQADAEKGTEELG